MMNRIYPAVWLALPKETRSRLVIVFGLVRTGVTEIRDQEVVSDGYTVEDLGKITLEAMCEYIGSQETFGRAWEITLAKVHAELNPPVGVVHEGGAFGIGEDGVLPTFEDGSNSTVAEAIKSVSEEFIAEEKFCDTCESKGVRHLKGCPKYVPIEAHSTKSNPYAKL